MFTLTNLFFYFEKINVYTKKGLDNAHPAFCSTVL
jgi:hypothetical protein